MEPDAVTTTTQATPTTPRRRIPLVRGTRIVRLLAIMSAVTALCCYASYRYDGSILRAAALEIAKHESSNDRRVLEIANWIHWKLPTARNEAYFLVPTLRATPMHVLDRGGDCSDKSRLLAAMLREIGIPATLALCFHPETGLPSHTVVEAHLGPGQYMLVDPSFNLHYPKPAKHEYYGIIELRNDPTLLLKRLAYVQAVEPRLQALHWYDPNVASFVGLSTFNWNKNAVTRLIHDVLFLAIGEEVYRLPRPGVMEEPKLTAALALVLTSLVLLLGSRALRRMGAMSRRLLAAQAVSGVPARATGSHAVVLPSPSASATSCDRAPIRAASVSERSM